MISLKNSSEKTLFYSFDGGEFKFGPGEIKLLDDKVVKHLLHVSMTCAVGGSPLKVIPNDKAAEALLASPKASLDIVVLKNVSDKDVHLQQNGIDYVVPAGKILALPSNIAKVLFLRHVQAKRDDLVVDSPVAKTNDSIPSPSSAEKSQEEKEVDVKKNKWRK